MILISHRGNTSGPNKLCENRPSYLEATLSQGFEVELDVWYKSGEFYLGHDEPKDQIKESFLENEKFWAHAKDIITLSVLIKNPLIHCFFHQEDDVTLTSKNYLWTYPGKLIGVNAIAVCPERVKNWYIEDAVGICSDFLSLYI